MPHPESTPFGEIFELSLKLLNYHDNLYLTQRLTMQ